MSKHLFGQRAQTSFEYVLLAAGIILLIVVILLVVQGNVISPISTGVSGSVSNYSNLLGQFNGS